METGTIVIGLLVLIAFLLIGVIDKLNGIRDSLYEIEKSSRVREDRFD